MYMFVPVLIFNKVILSLNLFIFSDTIKNECNLYGGLKWSLKML